MTGVHLNDAVRVRLTPYGEAVLADYHAQRRQRMGDRAYIYRPDAEGLYGMPLWDLMRIFGASIGMTRPPPFEGEIQIRRPAAVTP